MLDQRRAIQLYLENRDKFPGMSQSDAISAIRRSGGVPAAGVPAVPQGAIASALPAAPTPQLPAPAAEPVPAEGASEEPAYMNAQEAALAAFTKQYPEIVQAVAKPGARVDYRDLAKRDAIEARRAQLKESVEIARSVNIAPEVQAVIDDRLKRYAEDILNVDKDRKQAVWMAIAQAGMKMAQSQSPYFIQALASGMEAGVEGYSDAKAKAAERKARLQEAKEELTMKAVQLRDQAVKDAIAERNASVQGAAAQQALDIGAIKNLVAGETAGEEIKAPGLRNLLTNEQIATARQSRALAAEANARANRAEARALSGGAGGAGNVKLSQINPIVNGAISENNRLREQLSDPIARLTPQQKQSMMARIQANDQIIQYGRSLQRQRIGMGSGFRILGPE